ncbi:hypothetical protein [Thiobacillus sp.]|uniref:hypothetical protein n=1 Tax=Thiobacillus sp. TaxID=924 RepID=UPI00286E50DF|nr:hypothetical protein [Thiobacillus sp.]
MLRTSLLAAVLLATPLAALASGGYYAGGHSSRVIVNEPSVAVSIGAPLSGFNLYYQSGGYYAPVAPVYYHAPVIVPAPYYPPHRVQYYPARHDWHGGGRHHHRDRDDDHRGRGHGRGHGHDRDD